jgi:hypothetical protein
MDQKAKQPYLYKIDDDGFLLDAMANGQRTPGRPKSAAFRWE